MKTLHFWHWSMRKRMLLLFYMLVLLLVGCAWLVHIYPARTDKSFNSLISSQKTAAKLTDVSLAVQNFRIMLLRATLFTALTPTGDQSQFLDDLRMADQALQTALNAVRELDASRESEIRALLPDTQAILMSTAQLASAGRSAELAAQFRPLNPRFDRLNDLLTRDVNASLAEEQRQVERVRKLQDSYLGVTKILLAFALLVAARVTWLLHRGVLDPLAKVSAQLDQLTQSDAPAAPPASMDEFQRVTLALNRLQFTQKALNDLAYINSVSGLPNRYSLRLELEKRESAGQECALLFVDLDNFRTLNEALGPQAGDDCLKQFAQRLKNIAEPTDRTFHYGADLFAVVLSGHRDLKPVCEGVASRIRELCGTPVVAVGQQIRLSVSMGAAVMPEHGGTAALLISAADAAVHDAKLQDRTRLLFAKGDVSGRAQRNLILAEDIRRGLREGEFVSYFQPIVDLERNCVVSAEALIRWQHRDAGLVLPGRFLDVAEQTGELARITDELFITACREFAAWPGANPPTLAFNFSPREINDSLPDRIRKALDVSGLPGHQLEIEITETAVMQRPEQAAVVLGQLRKMGVGVCLDDFGTGYSSLGLLQRLPVTKIKLDRSFVITLGTSRESYSIVSAIIGIARSLNLKLVAEGVETQKQLDYLKAVGCTLVQGFYFSKGIPFEEFRTWSPQPLAAAPVVVIETTT